MKVLDQSTGKTLAGEKSKQADQFASLVQNEWDKQIYETLDIITNHFGKEKLALSCIEG